MGQVNSSEANPTVAKRIWTVQCQAEASSVECDEAKEGVCKKMLCISEGSLCCCIFAYLLGEKKTF